ncbi:phage tail protein [Clostridium sp. Sa3CUN1]|uniref:Phage tail protein n=1 Tax=Clostridium gallinarum TaxID=2762246 RepID=A0ABR8Q2D9_9CLOT|nr:phage tail spike protein [Clostridium gallinarum]MBD7914565.1 phage tail protein [Clostridium gallinarum]
MIEIYLKSNTNYKGNGNITLNPTSCIYKDSEKELTLEHFLDEEGRWKYIEYENVIAAEENGKKKLYRIYNVVRSLYSVTAYARPIFYDLADKVLLDVRPTNKLGEEALNIILQDTPFTGHSNLTTVSTSYYIRKNIVEALLSDDENSFLNRWGGEFYCENFDVYINDRIGSDNGVRVEFGYNLNEIEEDINIENVVTRIIPVGFNGIMLEGITPWVDSPLINKYTQPKMRVIEFSDIKVKENSDDEEGFNTIEEAREELIKQCNLLYENGIDKPAVNYKIDMINLANTTEYKNFKMLVNVNKGDTVTCYIPHLAIDVKARVIDYERDLITGEYISIELGNAVDNFFNEQADIQATVNKITNSNGTVNAGEIQGVINAIQTQFKALKDIAQPQDVRAMLFEDKVEGSPTFGCLCIGTSGFEIASSFKPGTTEWDFRTFGTGQGFIADCIIAGILMSRNGVSWLNLDNGTFDFANGNLAFDGIDLTFIGKMINILNGYGVQLDRGGLSLTTSGENVGGLRASYLPSDTNINGVTLTNLKNGDYVEITTTESENFDGTVSYSPKLRITRIEHENMKNFKGIQLLENVLLISGKKFWLESNDTDKNNWHEVYNSTSGHLCVFGDNGVILGYKNGSEKIKVIEIDETVSNGIQAFLYKSLNLTNNKITGVSDIFVGDNTGRYMNEGWCGTIQKIAKRVSNLNVSYESGWYAFGSGTNGAPCNYGVMLNIKWGNADIADGAQLVIEIGTGRLFTRATTNNGANWSAWVEK